MKHVDTRALADSSSDRVLVDVEGGAKRSTTRPTSVSAIATTMSTSSVDRGSPLNELARDPPTR
jgi:hypothetical protein